MPSGTFPPGSEILLFLTAASGVATWWASNFSNRPDLTRIFALSGVLAAVSLVIWVFSV